MKSFLEEMDGLNELVYMADTDTYELLYINKCGMERFGIMKREEIRGRKCYEVLQGLKSPCEFCTNSLLDEEQFYEWETTNRHAGGQYLLKDKLVEYNGKKVRMEIAFDISERENQKKKIERMLANEQIVLEIAKKLQGAKDEEETLKEILGILGNYMQGICTYIFEIHSLSIQNAYEWFSSEKVKEIYKQQENPAQAYPVWMEAFERKKAYIVRDIEELKIKNLQEYSRLKQKGVKSLIVIPMYEQEQIIGLLGIDNALIDEGDNLLETLWMTAFFVQSTLIRIKENKNLYMQSFMDIMTGVRNRNAFIQDVEKMNEEMQVQMISDSVRRCGIIFVDINGLKRINDISGHAAGDQRLTWVASRILEVFCAQNVYRTGGDEFVIICMGIEKGEFREKAAALERRICGRKNQDSASVGSCWSEDYIYLEEIINLAEAKMYEAKKKYYTEGGGSEHGDGRLLPEGVAHTSLLLREIEVISVASELLHLIFENWNEERIYLLLDEEFMLFEEERQMTYTCQEAVRYLRKQQQNNRGQKLRDLQFIRKRMAKGISICICQGRLDWKAEDGRTCSVPVAMTLILVQKEGRGRCLYIHSANVFQRTGIEKSLKGVNYTAFLNMLSGISDRIAQKAEETGNREMFQVLADTFRLMTHEYTNVYYVDIQKDTYIVLKREYRFEELVGVAGNYTGINKDYAELFMDEAVKSRYLEFTSRRNLLARLDAGESFLHMDFSTSREKTNQTARKVEVGIWLGMLGGAPVAVIAYRNSQKLDSNHIEYDRDKLTGLLSYEKFREEGKKILEGDSKDWIMVSSDVQNFKYINEVLGYEAGDEVLRAFARNLAPMEEGRMYHARASADLYLSFFKNSLERTQLLEHTQKNISQFCEEQKKKNDNLRFVLRTGIYFLDENCREIDTVIDRANLARKSIGQRMNSEISVYGEEIVRKSSMQNEILATMERALENKEFQIWMQPKINLKTRELCGAEALVRWVRNNEVRFYPDDFVPLFEQNGFITSMDLYVLEEVCRQVRLGNHDRFLKNCPVSINLSAVDVQQGGIVETISEIVERYQIPFENIEFELTETAYFNNSNMAIYVMQRLQEEGFSTSVDDFGSGYSVMNMLANMPASVVKIDRMFMLDSLKTEKGSKFLEKLIVMIHELGYRVLCEGIETEEQYEAVRTMGCDEGQGYYFYKPMPMQEFYKQFNRDGCGKTF